jgi:hypothetical protein
MRAYQSSYDLYASLASVLKSSPTSPITYQGCYSIIAESSIGHSKRIKLFGKELKTVVGLKFKCVSIIILLFTTIVIYISVFFFFWYSRETSMTRSATGTSDSKTFSCECGYVPASQKAPAPSASNGIVPQEIKRTQSDLSRWFGGPSTSSMASPMHCGGTVCLSAEDDDSHWLGIKGQKIVIKVEHPRVVANGGVQRLS